MSLSGDDVRRQLDRLLASSVFANAGRMSRFLKFVVEQTLAGEGERLKEYVIGVEVFDRDASYDPRLDSIVRVEAARLRSKLAEYYAGDGRGDTIVLKLPKGGYAPIATLEPRSAAMNGAAATNGAASAAVSAAPAEQVPQQPQQPQQPQRARWRWALGGVVTAVAATVVILYWTSDTAPSPLRVAVLPFSVVAGAERETLAQQLTEGVTAELVRKGRFSVIASSSARVVHSTTQRSRDAAAELDADVLIQARVTGAGDQVRVETYAVSGAREEKLWVSGFEGTVANADALERDIAAGIAEALGSYKAY
jgi:TolB-like protein